LNILKKQNKKQTKKRKPLKLLVITVHLEPDADACWSF